MPDGEIEGCGGVGFTVTVMGTLAAEVGLAHERPEMTMQVTMELVLKATGLNEGLLMPKEIPLICH